MPLSPPKTDARTLRMRDDLNKKLAQEKNIQQIAGMDARRQKRMNELLDQLRPMEKAIAEIDVQLKNRPKPLLQRKLDNDRANHVRKQKPLRAEYDKLAKEQAQLPAAHKQAMARYDQLVDEIQELQAKLRAAGWPA